MWGIIETPPKEATGGQDDFYSVLVARYEGNHDFTVYPPPRRPELSRLYINGQKQRYGVDYTFNQLGTLIYRSLDYKLKPSHRIELYHH